MEILHGASVNTTRGRKPDMKFVDAGRSLVILMLESSDACVSGSASLLAAMIERATQWEQVKEPKVVNMPNDERTTAFKLRRAEEAKQKQLKRERWERSLESKAKAALRDLESNEEAQEMRNQDQDQDQDARPPPVKKDTDDIQQEIDALKQEILFEEEKPEMIFEAMHHSARSLQKKVLTAWSSLIIAIRSYKKRTLFVHLNQWMESTETAVSQEESLLKAGAYQELTIMDRSFVKWRAVSRMNVKVCRIFAESCRTMQHKASRRDALENWHSQLHAFLVLERTKQHICCKRIREIAVSVTHWRKIAIQNSELKEYIRHCMSLNMFRRWQKRCCANSQRDAKLAALIESKTCIYNHANFVLQMLSEEHGTQGEA